MAAKADELHLSRDMFRPSLKAYSNMQRLVSKTDATHATQLRVRFQAAGVPTHGFDTEESEKRARHFSWPDFVVGCVVLVAGLSVAAWAFAMRELSPDQRFILLWILPIAGGFSSRSFAGSISAKGKELISGTVIAAGGGFAIWLLSYFLLPKP